MTYKYILVREPNNSTDIVTYEGVKFIEVTTFNNSSTLMSNVMVICNYLWIWNTMDGENQNNSFYENETVNENISINTEFTIDEEKPYEFDFSNLSNFIFYSFNESISTLKKGNQIFIQKDIFNYSNKIKYFNFVLITDQIGVASSNETNEEDYFGNSNKYVKNIILIKSSKNEQNDGFINIFMNAFKKFENLENIYIYGIPRFINTAENNNYVMLHQNLINNINNNKKGKIKVHLFKPALITPDNTPNYQLYIEEFLSTNNKSLYNLGNNTSFKNYMEIHDYVKSTTTNEVWGDVVAFRTILNNENLYNTTIIDSIFNKSIFSDLDSIPIPEKPLINSENNSSSASFNPGT